MNTFENIMENGAFAPKEQMLHFPKYMFFGMLIFQRRQEALLWNKGLIKSWGKHCSCILNSE